MNDPADKGREPVKYLRPRRPFPLKVIFWVFALWTLLGWLRFGRAVGEAELILDLVGLRLFSYLLLAGLIWGLLGLPVLWGLVRRARWTPLLMQAAAVIYPVLYWVERLLLWRDPYAQRNWPFMLLLTGVWFGLMAWGLRAAHTRSFFTDQNERG
jgi:hypothetical protein